MKIANTVRSLYNDTKDDYQIISDEISPKIERAVNGNGWFFRHRLKELESFALKIETGRFGTPKQLEDFFGCTIIVPTIQQIEEAEKLITSLYSLAYRRPEVSDVSKQGSADFTFNDLRLYLKLGESSTGRYEHFSEYVFEVQIKTILQHAWSIASHDLIYKTDNVSWSTERIAFQVKAMLEHAEVAIAEAQSLAKTPSLSKSDNPTLELQNIIEKLTDIWPSERLPKDVKRLAQNIQRVFRSCSIDVDMLPGLVEAEVNRIGTLSLNLSPYAFVIQALANSNEIDFKNKLKKSRSKILVHADMELPSWLEDSHNKVIRI